MDVWAKLGLGVWAVYLVWSGPQLGPRQASTVGPHVGYCVDVWAKLGLGFLAVY